MQVKEAIAILQTFDPNLNIMVECEEVIHGTHEINNIEFGEIENAVIFC